MLVRDAKAVARQWIEEESCSLPGFHGAYLAGSMSAMPDDAVLPAASDVDVKVVVDDPAVLANPQKFVYRDAVFDVSYGSREDVASPEAVLGSYYTAVHFAYPSIIADPSGQLTEIQTVVAREYPRREWVRKRCEHARRNAGGEPDRPVPVRRHPRHGAHLAADDRLHATHGARRRPAEPDAPPWLGELSRGPHRPKRLNTRREV